MDHCVILVFGTRVPGNPGTRVFWPLGRSGFLTLKPGYPGFLFFYNLGLQMYKKSSFEGYFPHNFLDFLQFFQIFN